MYADIPVPGDLLDWPTPSTSTAGRTSAVRAAHADALPLREPVHKSCAEAWIAASPVEARLGRFASDVQAKRRRDDDHA
ncbi:hypothetical protein ACFQ2K_02470 [Streptomyces sanglieri]|uniref:Uncharacterized protein n=1 Tax=Streptomyces sanglieri TaxID=193460 RepID=A0ABW2WK91_9ACTN